jgi:putative ABC transport system permease protein
MPAWFNFPDQSVKLWKPIYQDMQQNVMESFTQHQHQVIGRLKPGVTEAQAVADLSVIVRRLHDEHGRDPYISKSANSRPLLEAMVGEVRRPLYLLLCATACLLLIACLNVANLMVARGAARTRELAIRTALGGRRWRLFCEHWTESLLLSAAGGAIGCALSYGAVRWFVHLRKDAARIETVHIDGLVLAFACGLILLCALLASMASTVFLNRGDILAPLRESSRTHSIGRGGVGLRKGLLSMEVALTLVLLLVAGLLLKSYQRLRSSEMGCITENVIAIALNLPEESYPTPAQRLRFFDSLMAQVRTLPGVRAAARVSALPGEGYFGDSSFNIVENPLPLSLDRNAILRWADPGYFSALGIPLLRGRTFREDARLEKAEDEVVINDSFARKFFPGEDPIGKHLSDVGPHPYTITGIVGDTRFSIQEPPRPMMYFSMNSGKFSGGSLAIRSERNAADLRPSIRRLVQQLNPDLAIADIRTLDEIIGLPAQDRNFEATLLLAFAGLSLALAAAGLFGVLSYIVAQRTSEIGIRMALGAQRLQVLKSMLLDGLYPAFAGVVLGIVGGSMAVRLIRSMLYGISPFDPMVFACVVSLLLLVSVVACLAPAWQASRLNPMAALRSE